MTTGELPWGYTMHELHQLVGSAAWGVQNYGDYDLVREDCYDGIVDWLWRSYEKPTKASLVFQGRRRAQQEREKRLRSDGYDRHGQAMPRFAAYWLGDRYTPSPEPAIVNRLGLEQAWAALDPADQRTLSEAAYRRSDEMAALWGLTPEGARWRIKAAYRRFDVLLHGEPRKRNFENSAPSRRKDPIVPPQNRRTA